MLEFRHMSHAYNDNPSVRDVSFSVSEGEVVTLLGPSGCGKTTLLRLAAGLERPRQGEIWLDGKLVSDAGMVVAPETRGVGFMFQDYALFPHLNVLENVLFGLREKGSAATRRGLDVLAETSIEHLADSYPHELSGGQQQRVALARAIADKPEILLFDEPTSGLDPITGGVIDRLILDSVRRLGATALTISHDMASVRRIADKVAMVHNGVIIWCGPAEEMDDTGIPEVHQFVHGLADGPLTLAAQAEARGD